MGKAKYILPNYIDFNCNGFDTLEAMCDFYNVSVENYNKAIELGYTNRQILKRREILDPNDLFEELELYSKRKTLEQISDEYGFTNRCYLRHFVSTHRKGRHECLSDEVIRDLMINECTKHIKGNYFTRMYNIPQKEVEFLLDNIRAGNTKKYIVEQFSVNMLPEKSKKQRGINKHEKKLDVFYSKTYDCDKAIEEAKKHTIDYFCRKLNCKNVNMSYIINYYVENYKNRTMTDIARSLNIKLKLLVILVNKANVHSVFGENEVEAIKINAPYVNDVDMAIAYRKELDFISNIAGKRKRKTEPEIVDFITNNYETMTAAEIAKALGVSRNYVCSVIGSRKITKDSDYMYGHKRMARSYGRNVSLERKIYEDHYGKLPSGTRVIFINGDKEDFSIENLFACKSNFAYKAQKEIAALDESLKKSYMEALMLEMMVGEMQRELKQIELEKRQRFLQVAVA